MLEPGLSLAYTLNLLGRESAVIFPIEVFKDIIPDLESKSRRFVLPSLLPR